MEGEEMENRLEPIPANSYLPLREIVYETLKDAIRKKIYKPGDRIMESKIADELKVSRTPVREAIRRLEQEGYLFTIYHRGTFVPNVTLRDIEDIFAIRGALESYACGMLAERIKDDNEVAAKEAVTELVGRLRPLTWIKLLRLIWNFMIFSIVPAITPALKVSFSTLEDSSPSTVPYLCHVLAV